MDWSGVGWLIGVSGAGDAAEDAAEVGVVYVVRVLDVAPPVDLGLYLYLCGLCGGLYVEVAGEEGEGDEKGLCGEDGAFECGELEGVEVGEAGGERVCDAGGEAGAEEACEGGEGDAVLGVEPGDQGVPVGGLETHERGGLVFVEPGAGVVSASEPAGGGGAG